MEVFAALTNSAGTSEFLIFISFQIRLTKKFFIKIESSRPNHTDFEELKPSCHYAV